jgi:hypothetical protein
VNLYRRFLTLALAAAVAASSAVCFSQSVKKEKEIYNESADARAEVKEALEKATAEHKRVIVVFGASIRLFIVRTWRRYSPPTMRSFTWISEGEKRTRT